MEGFPEGSNFSGRVPRRAADASTIVERFPVPVSALVLAWHGGIERKRSLGNPLQGPLMLSPRDHEFNSATFLSFQYRET